jgi:gas vesicle protein
MDILLTIVSFVAGAVVSWLFARQSSKELKQLNGELRRDNAALKTLVEKLPTDFRSAVANDPRATLTAQQLQDVSRTVAELTEHQQARRLSVEQREAFVWSLKVIPPQQIGVFGSPSDSESMQFAQQIGGAFLSAGWPTEIRPAVHADHVEGIHIVYLTGESSQLPSSEPGLVTTLMTAFENASLNATATPLAETAKQMAVYIAVGHKPRT